MQSRLYHYLRLARFDKPTGIWLLLWPCWWAIALAAPRIDSMETLRVLLLFALGAMVMRAAGCIVNDMWDRQIDAKVERTKNRPLASGAVSMPEAFLLLVLLLLVGLWVIVQLPRNAILLGFLFCIPVVIYPLMKRVMNWPQLVLGLTFNAGALIGWVAVRSELELPAWLLYTAGVFWTLGYDTIYGHQDKRDDKRIGVRSTALTLGKHNHLSIVFFYSCMTILIAMAGWTTFATVPWVFLTILALVFLLLLWQIKTADLDNPAACMARFRMNAWLGAGPFIGMMLQRVLSG